MTGKLRREIKQKKPFDSIQEEVVLSMLRTADQIAVPLADVLREANLSMSQYNVLRILRGSGDEALPCGEISERMVRRDPDVTRLLDRLESRGLIERSRGTADRRVVYATITAAGLKLLASLDKPVDAAVRTPLAHMPVSRLHELLNLLEEARTAE